MDSSPGFTDWPVLIGESVLLRQRLYDIDPEINPYTIPHVAASRQDLESAESRVQFAFDLLHKELLSYGNGWESFFSFAHLFKTDEFGNGDRWHRAESLLDIYYAEAPVPAGFPGRHDVYCFCANPDEVEDLFVLWKRGPVTDGGRPVSWLAGEEVQRFPNMHEFMLSVNEYLRRDLATGAQQ